MKKNKKLLLVVFVLMSVIYCKARIPKDYATFSGEIANYKGDFFKIEQAFKFVNSSRDCCTTTTINISKDGTFSSIIPIHKKDKALFFMLIGNETISIFLRKGKELNISFDMHALQKTISFKGYDEKICEYLIKKEEILKNIIPFYKLDEKSFIRGQKEKVKQVLDLLKKYKNKIIDKDFYLEEQKDYSRKINWKRIYEESKNNKFNYSGYTDNHKSFIGKPSPEFTNYENFKGGTSSLKDFKGKYVYIDVWSTG